MNWLSWRAVRRLAFALLVVGGTASAVLVYDRFMREEPAPYFASDEDHFLFGSIGTEPLCRYGARAQIPSSGWLA